MHGWSGLSNDSASSDRRLRGGSEPDRDQVVQLDGLSEVFERRHLLIAEFHRHHPLRVLDALALGEAPVEIGNGGTVLDEFAPRGRRLPVVQDLRGRAVAEVPRPGCVAQGSSGSNPFGPQGLGVFVIHTVLDVPSWRAIPARIGASVRISARHRASA